MGQPRGRPPARAAVAASVRPRGIAAAASPAARIDETRSASSSSGEVPGRPRVVDPPLVDAGRFGRRRERRDARRVELRESRDEGADRDAVRAVARLPDGRIPAPREPLAGPLPERLAQQLVEEGAEHELGPVAPRPRRAPQGGRRPPDRAAPSIAVLHRLERGRLLRGQEPGDRRAEGDRCRLGAGQPVDLVGLERRDPVEEPGERLGRIGRSRTDVPGRASRRRRGSRPPVSRTERRRPRSWS